MVLRLPHASQSSEALANLRLEAAICRAIVNPPSQRVRKVFLIDTRVRRVVSVLIVLAITEAGHQTGRRISEMKGHRLSRFVDHVCLGFGEGLVDRVGFGSAGKIERGLCQRQLSLWRAEEVIGV